MGLQTTNPPKVTPSNNPIGPTGTIPRGDGWDPPASTVSGWSFPDFRILEGPIEFRCSHGSYRNTETRLVAVFSRVYARGVEWWAPIRFQRRPGSKGTFRVFERWITDADGVGEFADWGVVTRAACPTCRRQFRFTAVGLRELVNDAERAFVAGELVSRVFLRSEF